MHITSVAGSKLLQICRSEHPESFSWNLRLLFEENALRLDYCSHVTDEDETIKISPRISLVAKKSLLQMFENLTIDWDRKGTKGPGIVFVQHK